MLWLVLKGGVNKTNASYQITSCNMLMKNGEFELWVERPNGKGLKISSSKDKAKVEEIKDAIDFAISKREPTLELEV